MKITVTILLIFNTAFDTITLNEMKTLFIPSNIPLLPTFKYTLQINTTVFIVLNLQFNTIPNVKFIVHFPFCKLCLSPSKVDCAYCHQNLISGAATDKFLTEITITHYPTTELGPGPYALQAR